MTDPRNHLARLLYNAVRETCIGYIDYFEYEEDPEDPCGHVIVDGEIDFKDLADTFIKALGLYEERRINTMSSAGMTIDTRTGETTYHSDIRYDHRYVTNWTPA